MAQINRAKTTEPVQNITQLLTLHRSDVSRINEELAKMKQQIALLDSLPAKLEDFQREIKEMKMRQEEFIETVMTKIKLMKEQIDRS